MKKWLIILMALLWLFTWPQKTFSSEEKCTLGRDGKFSCVYKYRKKKFRLNKWAEAFCKNRGYDFAKREVMDDCRKDQCRAIHGTCLNRGQGTLTRSNRHCELLGTKVDCRFKYKKLKGTLNRWAQKLCKESGYRDTLSKQTYYDCNISGKQCKRVIARCVE